MERERVSAWVAAYEHAWRAPGTDALATIFTPDASYRQAPYRPPVVGLDAIARMWEQQREGPDEVFRMRGDIVAVEGDTAVVRVEVHYGDPVTEEYRDLWIVRFADDGRCRAFEEWPFTPERSAEVAPDGA
ncbi:nuclear transport factor 2 family protein [Micromonospora sp. NPDC049559]|uniref:nuclear transport factor 2 family protein n=1 Tax=Micromonospora sp. NPDC049559 TaxID=3155923 RepID=UPI0034437484